jgi:hypothetical protein
MNRDEITAVVHQVFEANFGKDALDSAKNSADVFKMGPGVMRSPSDLDSLDRLEFVMALEDALDVEIPEEHIFSINSLEIAVDRAVWACSKKPAVEN